jgi:hypothetical protein
VRCRCCWRPGSTCAWSCTGGSTSVICSCER